MPSELTRAPGKDIRGKAVAFNVAFAAGGDRLTVFPEGDAFLREQQSNQGEGCNHSFSRVRTDNMDKGQ